MPHRHEQPPATQLLPEPLSISDATTITGAGIGRTIGVPTININLSHVPPSLQYGVYACFITVEKQKFMGALHYGPRPAVKAGIALEVHVIDEVLAHFPSVISLTIIGKIREVQDFPSLEAMRKKIVKDVEIARGMLGA